MTKPQRASPSYKIADCELSNSYLLIKMAFILGGTFRISDTRGPIGMKLWGCTELTLRLCIVIFSTSGRKSKPEVGLPHTISVLFWLEILPDDKVNDLESNELCINIGETGNTGENRKFS